MGGRFAVIVLDGCGVGGAPDAASFGDEGSDTLAHVASARASAGRPLRIPNLTRWGIGAVEPLEGVPAPDVAGACFGRMHEVSRAKDSTAGHWEMMGLPVDKPFPTYPQGFPPELVAEVSRSVGYELIGNEVASGTEIVTRLGAEAVRRRALIVYTSADSVFQLAAHENVVPVEELYRACETARALLVGEHAVGRVIARPFIGDEGAFVRTPRRKDFSLAPTGPTVLDALFAARVPVLIAGKIGELFAYRGITKATHTGTNEETMDLVLELLHAAGEGLIFANLGDFDTLWGHRNDVEGFAEGLEAFDLRLGEVTAAAGKDDMVVVTADHGCDPVTVSTDHSREMAPLLVWAPGLRRGASLGVRETFADVGASAAEHFGVPWAGPGSSFLADVRAAAGAGGAR